MNKQFKIYLGHKACLTELAKLVTAAGFQGATLTPASGLYKGQLESSTIITIIGGHDNNITSLARTLKAYYKQACVLVATEAVNTRLV